MKRVTTPSQASLDKVLVRATRVLVVDWEEVGRGVLQRTRVLAEFNNDESLAQLRNCLRIIEDPTTLFHCMCIGEEALELHGATGTLATIGLHHGRSIRWEVWSSDATLENGRRLLEFLAARGVSAPLERFEGDQRQAERAEREADRWRDAMPSCLHPFWDEMRTLSPDLAPMRRALQASLPDPIERVLVLLRWFGSGEGPWNQFPSYESVPEQLLLEEPTEHLVAALTRTAGVLAPTQLEGAARYFAGWHFHEKKHDDGLLLTGDLRNRLLTHTLRSTDDDKIEIARRAFAE
jgi:hypothetical protein